MVTKIYIVGWFVSLKPVVNDMKIFADKHPNIR